MTFTHITLVFWFILCIKVFFSTHFDALEFFIKEDIKWYQNPANFGDISNISFWCMLKYFNIAISANIQHFYIANFAIVAVCIVLKYIFRNCVQRKMCRLTLFIKVLKECKSWKLWKLSFYNTYKVETKEDKNAFNTI